MTDLGIFVGGLAVIADSVLVVCRPEKALWAIAT